MFCSLRHRTSNRDWKLVGAQWITLPVCSVASVVSDSLQPLWAVAHQAPLSMGFSRQEYLSGLPGPPPGDLPNSGIQPAFLMSRTLTGRFFTTSATWEALTLPYGNAIPSFLITLAGYELTHVDKCVRYKRENVNL